VDKEDVHIYTMEYYSAIKMNEIMEISATWMDLEITILSELCQTVRCKHYCNYLYVESKEKQGPLKLLVKWSHRCSKTYGCHGDRLVG